MPDPVLMLAMTISPVMSAQPLGIGGPGITMISVAETDCTIAAQPASVTATGAWNPRPKIVTGTNGPFNGWMLLLKEVITIGSVYV